jgi:predicted DNA-binding transcriptional regulator YafY
LTGLTADEAEALFLSGLPGPAAELGLGTVVAAARLKVLAALPPELRGRATRLVERFHLDAAGWFQTRRLEIDYDRGDGPAPRRLAPLGLVLKAGVWYLVAQVDDQMRTYRVSRVASARLLDERFDRPASFDLAAYWAESSAAYEAQAPRIDVVVRVRPDRMWRLRDAVGGPAVRAATRLDAADPDGWSHLRLGLQWPDEVPATLLRAGPDIEVLEPAEIRERVERLARRVVERYAAGSVAGP